MAHSVINTKIEILAESIEDLCIAVSSRVSSRDYEAVTVARRMMRDALQEFLQPTLRVVDKFGPGETGLGRSQR